MKTPWWAAIAIFLCATLLQASLFPALGLSQARPDLVLQVVIIWAVLRGVREALPWAFVAGVMLDLFSGAPFGTATLALVLVAFCCSAGELAIFRSGFLLPTVTVFWASMLYGLVYLFLLRTHHYPVEWLSTMRHVVVPGAVMNTICAPATYWLVSRLDRATRAVTVEW